MAVARVKEEVRTPLGVHCHNDGELAVANTMTAVENGVRQIQGTINGFGERCGNLNLCSVLPNLQLKQGHKIIRASQLRRLREISHLLYELANVVPNKRQPYVGDSAFAHKGGLHVAGIIKNRETYEHIEPELVGSRQRVLVSDLSGRSNIVYKAREYDIDLNGQDQAVHQILNRIKELESQGYEFEAAEASFELLIQEALGKKKRNFRLDGFRVIDEKRVESEAPLSEATVKVEVNGVMEHAAALGNGPVHALDQALRKALTSFYPSLEEVELLDYKVRVLSSGEGTSAAIRVLIESGDGHGHWGTVGVSHNVIEAELAGAGRQHRLQALQGPKEEGPRGQEPRRESPVRGIARVLNGRNPRPSRPDLPREPPMWSLLKEDVRVAFERDPAAPEPRRGPAQLSGRARVAAPPRCPRAVARRLGRIWRAS